MKRPDWIKVKGYYHFSPQISTNWEKQECSIRKVQNKKYVGKYAFYPLLHVNIKERRYKKDPTNEKTRCHSYFDQKKNKYIKTEKIRPIHYPNHMDALIFSYYAFTLQELYETHLKSLGGLSDCVTAYRKVRIGDSDKNKGSIHFAADVFNEIKERVNVSEECIVLAFDIESFFSSLNHSFLMEKWADLLGVSTLPEDHLNVFNAVTNFSFIYKDDIRQYERKKGRHPNFDERRIAKTRNKFGINAFFETPQEFRKAIKTGQLRIYKNQFKNKETKKTMGIPQGLPISAVLANLYLLDFDKIIYEKLMKEEECFYRRYSDDIIIICDRSRLERVEKMVIDEIKSCHVNISTEKTEKFVFNYYDNKIHSSKLTASHQVLNSPLIYLGFEFYGYKTLIKSTNLSKFYRRMIYSIKKKCKRANKIAELTDTKPILFKRQLYKLYRNIDLDKIIAKRNLKQNIQIDTGEYRTKTLIKNIAFRSNYFSYARRASEILEAPEILNQIKGEKRIFNQAMNRYLNKH